MATRVRGVPVERPPQWTRGITPSVIYTGRPLEPPPARKLTKAGELKQRMADARVRRALVDAWRDPSRARKVRVTASVPQDAVAVPHGKNHARVMSWQDLMAAGTMYADLRDAQGLANAFVAHAQTRLADAYLAEWDEQLSVPASNMAREEYAHAHVLYSSLLDVDATMYSAKRQVSVHAVAVGQEGRPVPLTLKAEDARVAAAGVGV